MKFGKLFGHEVRVTGQEGPGALLSDASRCRKLFGPLQVNEQELLSWVADWVKQGGANLGKPTHFESRDGKY
jgi:hypothetical protein